MTDKLCKGCKLTLSLDCFTKKAQNKDGLDHLCRQCKHLDYLKRPPEKNREYARNHYKRNREKILAEQKLMLANPPLKWLEWRRAYDRERYRKNSAIYKTRSETRKAMKLQAMPQWADKKLIFAIYGMARLLDKLNPWIKHHVDHIVPLKGANVCGMHIPLNLRIISSQENLKKGNRLDIGNPTL